MACQNLEIFEKCKDFGPSSYRNLRFSNCQNLGRYHKNHVFLTQKPNGLLLRVKILGLLKSTKILGLHRIEILCLAPVEILVVFQKIFFWHLNPMAFMACQNLGDFKKCKDFGLTSYQNLRFNTCQNLWVFQKNRVFRHQNSTACRACQNLGVFEEHKDFGHTLYRKSQV